MHCNDVSSEFRVVSNNFLRIWETSHHPRRFLCAHLQPLLFLPSGPGSNQPCLSACSFLVWTLHMNWNYIDMDLCICLSQYSALRFISVFMCIAQMVRIHLHAETWFIPAGKISLRRKWQPPVVFFAWGTPWQRSLVGSPCRKELDMTERRKHTPWAWHTTVCCLSNSWWGCTVFV